MQIHSVEIAAITVPPNRRMLRGVAELAASIAEVGLLHPITLTTDNRLVAGYHRLEACRLLGWEKIAATVKSLDDLARRKIELMENVRRNDLSYLDYCKAQAELKAIYIIEHPETAHGGAPGNVGQGRGKAIKDADSASLIAPYADMLAAESDVSHRHASEILQVGESLADDVHTLVKDLPIKDQRTELLHLARMTPEDQRLVAARLVAGSTEPVKRMTKEMRKTTVRANNSALVAGVIDIESYGKFPTIVVDPPWDWGDDEADPRGQYGRAPDYATMSLDQIADLPVPTLAEDNAHIWLWITNHQILRGMDNGFSLLTHWGFRAATILTWGKPSIGTGYYLRGQTEHVIFGVKGSLELCRNDAGTLLLAGRPGAHSAKPEEFYDLVESCSPGPWLEMFARGNKRSGWKTWGQEAQKKEAAS